MKQVVTRFAPSPTGYLHIGGVRTALFCWLYARKHKGKYIVRVEDTDFARSTKSATDAIFYGLEWLGLSSDEETVFQTDRLDYYNKIIYTLLDKGNAYYCYCSKEKLDLVRNRQIKAGEKPRYNRFCRVEGSANNSSQQAVVRFKTPLSGRVIIDDRVHGQIAVNNEELDDFIIQRSDGTPTYNLTVVADDIDMQISHVIRGDDHINNTPKQIHIYNALNSPLPVFAHLPMINGQDGQKLSKRHGAVSVLDFKSDGFLPIGLLNYLARLGWSHGDQEIFTMSELVDAFDINDVNKSAASFDHEKLLWINQQHIRRASIEYLAQALEEQLQRQGLTSKESGPDIEQVVQLYREKARTLKEMAQLVAYLYQDRASYSVVSAAKFLTAQNLAVLIQLKQAFARLDDWTAPNINQQIKLVVAETDLKFPQVAQPLRIALTGDINSPSIDQTLALAGREMLEKRLQQAIAYIEQNNCA